MVRVGCRLNISAGNWGLVGWNHTVCVTGGSFAIYLTKKRKTYEKLMLLLKLLKCLKREGSKSHCVYINMCVCRLSVCVCVGVG